MTRTVQVIAFDPRNGAVGGFEWRYQETAIEALWLEMIADTAHADDDLALFEVRVPEFLTGAEITEHVSEIATLGDYVSRRRRPALEAA